MYQKLIEFHNAGKLSFKYVKTFNMDEYVGKFILLQLKIDCRTFSKDLFL